MRPMDPMAPNGQTSYKGPTIFLGRRLDTAPVYK
jgi:hypothetical protein